MGKFKAGDRVRCIDGSNSTLLDRAGMRLASGALYTVAKDSDPALGVNLVEFEMGGFYEHRFELAVTSTPTAFQPNTVLKVIRYVTALDHSNIRLQCGQRVVVKSATPQNVMLYSGYEYPADAFAFVGFIQTRPVETTVDLNPVTEKINKALKAEINTLKDNLDKSRKHAQELGNICAAKDARAVAMEQLKLDVADRDSTIRGLKATITRLQDTIRRMRSPGS